MTDRDRKFLARLVASNKRVIDADCKARKLGKEEYFRRAARCDRKAKEIETRLVLYGRI